MANDTDDRDEWLTITADAKVIEESQRLAEDAQRERVEGVIHELRSPDFYLDHVMLSDLKNGREEAISRLNSLAQADPVSEQGLRAAAVLCKLRAPEGRRLLTLALEHEDPEIRLRALEAVPSIDYDPIADGEVCMTDFLNVDEGLTGSLIRQLDSDDRRIVEEAVDACGSHQVPGWRAKILTLLRSPNSPGRGRLLSWVSHGEMSEDILEVAVAASRQWQGKGEPEGLDAIVACSKAGNPELRSRARLELKRIIGAWPDELRGMGTRGDRLNVLETLAITSDPSDLGWLMETVERERGLYQKAPLAAVIRLEGAAGRRRLIQALADPEIRPQAISIAAELFEGARDVDLINALASGINTDPYPYSLWACRALLAIGGEEVHQYAHQLLDRLPDSDRAVVQQVLAGYTIADIQRGAVKSGVLGKEVAEKALARIREANLGGHGESPGLIDLLTNAGIAFSFDVETDMHPCRHDLLVREFSRTSRGVFMPEAVSEKWHREAPEDFDAACTLQFVSNGRLYRGTLENLGDWYDVERTGRMINRALSDSSRPERFIAWTAGGQAIGFVFADPRLFRPLAEKYSVALSSDLNDAMQLGLEFEERVRGGIEPQDLRK